VTAAVARDRRSSFLIGEIALLLMNPPAVLDGLFQRLICCPLLLDQLLKLFQRQRGGGS
jgi:hypothetical protein